MPTSHVHHAIPAGFELRRPTAADADAVASLRREVEIAVHGDTDVTLEQVKEEWALPRLDLRHDAWLVLDEGGTLAAYGLCWVEAPPGDIVADQIVSPSRRGHGLTEALLDLCEERAAHVYRAAAPEREGSLGLWTPESDKPRRALYERRGYRHVRTFLRLDRDLTAPVESPVDPAGISVHSFRRGHDETAVHAAGEEAFLDHFRPSEMSLEEWLEFRFVRDDLDHDLWLIARDGDQVAGGVLAFETPVGGYVDELFVRRPWRGRGLGRALLLRICAELRRRGQPVAYLGVDSENPTGAMHLYGSAGFSQSRQPTLVYEKPLVPVPQ